MSSKRFLVPLVICVLALATVAWAQTTGSMRGEVIDSEGKPLPGATVTIKSDALIGQTRTAYTNELGVFRFPSLPVGAYSVEVTMEGFEIVRVPRVDISLEQTASVPVSMKFATRAENVTVIGETPVIDVTDAGLSTSFKNELLEEVPTQRSMTDLMQLAPGVSASFGDSGGDRTIAFGSNMQSNSWNVDGVDTSAPETGSVWWTVNPDLIEEVQVIGVGAPAEYGNHLGAVFNVVTKKGGNELHGGASYYFQHDSLVDPNVELDPGEVSCTDPDCVRYNLDKYRNFSSQLGGPILKDRVWFFGGFEYSRNAYTDPGSDPNFAPIYKSDKYDLKVTGRIGEKHEVNGFVHHEEWDFPDSPLPNFEASALSGERGSNPAWGGGWTSTLSNNFLLEANYAGWWSDDVHDSRTGSFEDPFFDYTPADGSGVIQYSGGVYYPWDYITWKSQFKGKATYYAEDFLNSEHEFKFGVQYSYGSAETNVGLGPNGFYTYSYYGYLYRAYQTPYQYGGINKDLGFFVDDTITVNDNLTLNLGVRFDHNTGRIQEFERLTIGEPSISPAGNFATTGELLPGVDVLNWNLVSPRLGFVYQPRGDARSKLQGSFGVYYDHNVSGNWDYPPPEYPTFRVFYFNPDTGLFDIPFYEIEGSDVAINPDLKAPRTLQYALGYEQQFGQSLAAGVQYVYKDTQDLVGWEILGGVYEEVPFVDPFTGQQYTLLNIVENPIFRKGNDPGNFPGSEDLDYFQKYHAVIFTFDKRLSNNWSLSTSYTWSRSTGLIPRMLSTTQFNPFYSSREGQDPNNFINAEGRLQGDRPHMFRLLTYVENLPGGLHASVSADFSSGKHHVRAIRTRLDQGNVDVILERDFRLDPFKVIDVTVGRRFNLGGDFIVRVDGTVFNVLNSDNPLELLTNRLQTTDQVFVPSFYTQPRRLQLRVGFEF